MGGFKHPRRRTYEPLNLDVLEAKLDAGEYDIAALRAKKIIRTRNPVKLLSRGVVSKKFSLSVHAVSAKARVAVEQVGGSITILKK